MGKFLVGLGLIVMMSAVAFYGLMVKDPSVSVAAANSAASMAAWIFIGGVVLAILGGLQRAR